MARLRPLRGFTLLEVLIALVVFSLGLLGLAGLMVMSVKTNHSAYLRTQATFLAQSMSDRMRANSMSVWAGTYSATYPISGSDPCAAGAVCGFADIAKHDMVLWGQQLTDQLPNASATIACTPTAGIATPNPASNPPYNGLCSMQIQWNEASTARDVSTPNPQVFAWVFQP